MDNRSLLVMDCHPRLTSEAEIKKVIIADLKSLKIRKKEEPNFVKCSIRKLTKRKDIVICPADMGGGIVILSKKQYTDMMVNLLSDANTYNATE